MSKKSQKTKNQVTEIPKKTEHATAAHDISMQLSIWESTITATQSVFTGKLCQNDTIKCIIILEIIKYNVIPQVILCIMPVFEKKTYLKLIPWQERRE